MRTLTGRPEEDQPDHGGWRQYHDRGRQHHCAVPGDDNGQGGEEEFTGPAKLRVQPARTATQYLHRFS